DRCGGKVVSPVHLGTPRGVARLLVSSPDLRGGVARGYRPWPESWPLISSRRAAARLFGAPGHRLRRVDARFLCCPSCTSAKRLRSAVQNPRAVAEALQLP